MDVNVITNLDPERIETTIQDKGTLVLEVIEGSTVVVYRFKPKEGPFHYSGTDCVYSGTVESDPNVSRAATLILEYVSVRFIVAKAGWEAELLFGIQPVMEG